jgi:phosphate transport system protein
VRYIHVKCSLSGVFWPILWHSLDAASARTCVRRRTRRSRAKEPTHMDRPTEHISQPYEAELEQLAQRLLVFGALAEQRVRAALAALATRDAPTCAALAASDDPLNRLHIEIDERCFKLLALRQPTASDLRAVLAAAKINTNLERVGDLAVNIAEAAQRYLRHAPVWAEAEVPAMGELAAGMLHGSLDAYVARDAGRAFHVLEQDDALDAMKADVFRRLLDTMLEAPATVEPALEIVLVSRHLERIGDHATNIAEEVIFIVSAEHVQRRAS